MSSKPTTATVDLDFPVEHEGTIYERLTFRRMRARDTLAAEGEAREIMAGYLMFAAMAEVDVEVILNLDVEDLEKVSEVVTPLMGKSVRSKVPTVSTPAT